MSGDAIGGTPMSWIEMGGSGGFYSRSGRGVSDSELLRMEYPELKRIWDEYNTLQQEWWAKKEKMKKHEFLRTVFKPAKQSKMLLNVINMGKAVDEKYDEYLLVEKLVQDHTSD